MHMNIVYDMDLYAMHLHLHLRWKKLFPVDLFAFYFAKGTLAITQLNPKRLVKKSRQMNTEINRNMHLRPKVQVLNIEEIEI